MTTIALATCSELPHLFADDAPLVVALRKLGASVEPVVWDDPAADWPAYDAVVVRSTWDYTWRREEFLAWADRVAAATALWNPAPVVRWNTDKTYLRRLAEAGVPVVPTVWADTEIDLDGLLAGEGWREAVVKPTVSAGARGALRFDRAEIAAAEELLRGIVAGGVAMVQPYFASVEDYGERSLVFVDGEHTHAVRRNPALARAGGGHSRDAVGVEAAADELAVARAVLDAAGEPLLYARVDLVRDDSGQPRLIELEAVEPQLFLRYAGHAAPTLARATLRRVA